MLHTATYWLMLALRDAVPRWMSLAWAEFTTLRRSPLKNLPRTRSGGGARVAEKAARVRIHFASACPDAALFRMLAGRPRDLGPMTPGASCPMNPKSVDPNPDTNELKSRDHQGAEQSPARLKSDDNRAFQE